MSGIILSASVRQNLLSLQSTADLLATTQNRLSTGKKVNTALDNPTNYFTAQGLDNRANDISNLLDSIGNGVQVLQAANTGITSLQKLVDTAKSIANQVLQAPAGYSVKASATSLAPTGAGALGVAGTATDLTNAGTNSLNGKTFVFTPATGAATTITVSSTVAAGNVNSIDAFNTALSAAGLGLTASLASDGSITLTSTNDNASQILTTGTTAAANTIAISGTDTATLVTPAGGSAGKPLADAASQTIRANLVSQYNNIIQQITTTSQDASFNGINLLNGDDLKLTFNETGKSTLTIKGVTFSAAGLGLASLAAGTDFLDSASANATIAKISAASNTLRTEASTLGSNLSIVQIRQDFSKNLINVLQTGSSNLTLADTNEEAANSQALSTRQSIAVSALALANQSQASVLQLLR
ncbi:MAG TPA: flagellin [Bradyrhizobium sp.]|uniref:flagellin N-terminal helical domain-containing protein n=1 Tax=Bradyrhizobium sp. TaxID=376 RepID=UPI002B48ECBA|nr:flagellin [Bradyrhizobium sp.]HKO70182.1 flagellin [Bradyrhizobium sp.]